MYIYRSMMYIYRSMMYIYRSMMYIYRSMMYIYRSMMYIFRSMMYIYRSMMYIYRSMIYIYRSMFEVGVQQFINDIYCLYICWFDGALIDLICLLWFVRSRGRWKGLIVSVDSILKNTWGLTVSCHKFRQVSIVWMLLLLDCGGCWIGVVLPPFGQKGLRPFFASYH